MEKCNQEKLADAIIEHLDKKFDPIESRLCALENRLAIIDGTPSIKHIEQTIRKLQAQIDTDVDGIIGPKTIYKLRRLGLTHAL